MILFNGLKHNNSLKTVLIAIAYIALAQFSLMLAFPQTNSIGVWFPAGLSLAMLILYGYRIWPAISLGAIVANMLLFLHQDVQFTVESVTTISFNAGINTIEPIFAYFLLEKFVKERAIFKHTANVFLFILVSILTSFTAGAIISFGMTTSHLLDSNSFIIYLFTYGTANLVSIFIITPFLVSWAAPFKLNISKKILIETSLFIIALTTVCSALLINAIAGTIEKSFSFILMPFIFWLAFRSNKQIITISVFSLSLVALYMTIQGKGPFVSDVESESILLLQIFLSIISITALIINTTVLERTKAEKALKQFNEKLEQSVKERTKELHEEINTRKATEEKIKISNKKLRKANSELDNFVYSVSHDLRAPIASVLGLVNLAKKENSVKAMRKYLDMVAKSAEQQDTFIKDILDLSRNARLDVAREKIEFKGIVNDIFDQYSYIDNSKNVVKQVNVKQKVVFQSDKSRIKVILNNVIANAIRHCNTKEVKVDVDIVVNEATASIVIKDNGQGIDQEHLAHIFKMFYRGTDSTAGSGLGLYIVKETIDKLRGAVNIDSEENKGTVVKFDIPNLYEKSVDKSLP